MTATFTLTGDLVALVGSAASRSAFVELDRPVVDTTNDVTYEMKSSTPVESVFTLTGLPAQNALNNANAAFNMVVTIGARKWLVAAQSNGSTHDLTEFPETTGLSPVDSGGAASAAASAAAAAASAASINREVANGVAGLDASKKLYEVDIPTRLGDTTLDAKYLVKGLTATTTVYVATTGNDSNSGLAVGTPFLTIQKAFDYLATQGPVLQGQWYVQIAAGTYTIASGQSTLKTRSVNPVIVRGPSVSGGVPTAIINGSGGGDYMHGLSAAGNGVKGDFRDLKFINFNGDPAGNSRIGALGEQGAWVSFNNVHVVGATWCGLYAFNAERAYVTGGILDGCRSGYISNTVQTTIDGTTIKNSTQEGIWWSRGAQGHIDNCELDDNLTAVVVGENSRAHIVTTTFKRNTTAIKTRTGGIYYDEGIIFGTGADVNTTDLVFAAGSGRANDLDTAAAWIRAGYDRTTRTSTGTLSEVTLSTVYTILARRLVGIGKSCRVRVAGTWTSVTAGSVVTVKFGGLVLPFTVPAASASTVSFVIDCQMDEVQGGYRATGAMTQGANGSRMGSVGSGFVNTSDQAVVITVTAANTGDTINVHRTDVYLMG